MGLNMASLLIHSEQLPASARDALKAAYGASPERRRLLLEAAARILHREVGVECSAARELLDLSPGDCGG
jgi:hypothetical protein